MSKLLYINVSEVTPVADQVFPKVAVFMVLIDLSSSFIKARTPLPVASIVNATIRSGSTPEGAMDVVVAMDSSYQDRRSVSSTHPDRGVTI